MKQRRELFALLMALCLLASLTVAAAAGASELESAVAAAQSELDAAKTTLTSAQQELDRAKASVSEAENALEAAKTELINSKRAIQEAEAAAGEGQEAPSGADLEKVIAELEVAAAEAEQNCDTAEEALKEAREAADIEGKQSAVNAAQAAVNEKQQALDEAKAALKAEEDKKQEEEAGGPAAPGPGDLSCPSSVDFGTLEKDAPSGSRTRTFTLKNNSAYDMALSASPPSGWTVSGLPGTLRAGESAAVTVRLNSAGSTGSYDERLTITASFAGGSGSGDFSVRLYAEVAEKGYSITADPAGKDLGRLKEGYTEAEAREREVTVTIENKGASSVRMDGVKGNDHFTVTAVKSESGTLENGGRADYRIAPRQGLAAGAYTDTITFQTREGAAAAFKAAVVIETRADPLTVEPAALDFGAAEEGYAALTPKTVTVKNNTEYAVQLEQPSSFSYETGLLGQTSLPAGGSAAFSIRPRTGLPANLYDGVVEVRGCSGDSALTARLTVKFTVNRPAGPSVFSDVAAGSTFAADIAYVSQRGLMSGVGDGRFNPQAPVTRGQLVTILYRLEGQPAVSGAGFPDVAAGSYCEKAVKWAAANAVTAGGSDGLFRPGDPITREQLAAFLYRYNNYKGYAAARPADLSAFADGSAVASYAKDALAWANGAGLVNGSADGLLNPSGGATRGQAAAILHRFCVSVGQ